MKTLLLPYGWIGLIIMAVSEILLFTGNSFAAIWMTPLMWSGYIILIDNIIYKRTGSSMITVSRGRFSLILLLSIGSWLIFEGYNVLLKNWHYINLPENIPVRYFGFAWSFATITPGILLTADLLRSFHIFEAAIVRPVRISNKYIGFLLSAGAVLSFYPLFFPNEYLFPMAWCGFILLIDPLNYKIGGKSLLADLSNGSLSRLFQLLLAGAICGVFWEFWNYWAETKWVYTVPYFPEIKLFEMPVAGYLGFPPFAIECYVIYHLCKSLLDKTGVSLRYE